MFWTDSMDWKKMAEGIRLRRRTLVDNTKLVPDHMYRMFNNIQGRFVGINEINFQERSDICELLFEIYMELNTLKPMGRDYKELFDSQLIDTFIQTFKMANDYKGHSFSAYGPSLVSWLEDYKKTYLNDKTTLEDYKKTYLNSKTMKPMDKTR